MLFVAAAGTDEDLLERALAARRLDACLIVTEQGCSYRLFMEHFFRERGILPDKQMEFWSMEAIKRCVESGLGISFLPRMAVREELASGRMTALRCDAELERFVTQIAWRRKRVDLSRRRRSSPASASTPPGMAVTPNGGVTGAVGLCVSYGKAYGAGGGLDHRPGRARLLSRRNDMAVFGSARG
jgi:hypothetical protein